MPCFGTGAWKGLRLLWTGEERYDLESYTAVHQGTIFGALTLLTGSIWAKASWGVWWAWSSNQLVLFLVLFLFYCAYFMLRFSLEPGPQRARISAVYALFGVALIPVSFLAIRLANDFIHPTVFTRHGAQMTGTMFAAFCVSWAALLVLAYRHVSRRAARQADRREPARPSRSARPHDELAARNTSQPPTPSSCSRCSSGSRSSRRSSYGSNARRRSSPPSLVDRSPKAVGRWLSSSSGQPSSRTARLRSRMQESCGAPGSRPVRFAIWGVRLGWLAQTALLVVQALRADGFPWGTWAGALNLFVWLVVGALPDLGLQRPLPPARCPCDAAGGALLVASWAGGGTGITRGVHSGAHPRGTCRPDACRSRGSQRCRGHVGALPLGGAEPEAS